MTLCQTWQILMQLICTSWHCVRPDRFSKMQKFNRQWRSQIGKGQMTYSLFWDFTYICSKSPTFRKNLTTNFRCVKSQKNAHLLYTASEIWKSSKRAFTYAVRFMEHEVWQQTLRIPVFWLCVAGEVIPDISKNRAAFIFKGMTSEDEGPPILRNVGKYLPSDTT